MIIIMMECLIKIANNYVAAIASALQEYQPGLPDQIYSDLAWAGLNGTPVFETKFPRYSTK